MKRLPFAFVFFFKWALPFGAISGRGERVISVSFAIPGFGEGYFVLFRRSVVLNGKCGYDLYEYMIVLPKLFQYTYDLSGDFNVI